MSNTLKKMKRNIVKDYNPVCRKCGSRMMMDPDDTSWVCKCGWSRPYAKEGRYAKR